MFKKILIILSIFFGLIIFSVLAVFFGLKIFFTESKLKKLSGDAIRGFISREASFGRLRWGPEGIAVEDFALSGRPDFSAGTFLAVKKAEIKPVFDHGRIAAVLLIDSPEITFAAVPACCRSLDDARNALVARADGDNIKRYGRFSLPVEITVKNGKIVFAGPQETEIREIAVKAVFKRSERLFETSIGGVVIRGKDRFEIESLSSVDISRGSWDVQKAEISENGKRVTISGQFDNLFLKEDKPLFSFNIQGDRTVVDNVLKLIAAPSGEIQFGEKKIIDLHIERDSDGLKMSER